MNKLIITLAVSALAICTFAQGGGEGRYGQRIKNRFFPFGAPESFFNALEVFQQPAAVSPEPKASREAML